ncbi:acyl-CoA synthetase [Rubrobacter aplysinae]|uniref:acyl-CoA synthetase n=1 Tax=Rubrobacter aplysinae TaxID=909625 RepID=UPI00064BAEBB|nr:acyl--CoA ligase [Rubrobacter aplysinae]
MTNIREYEETRANFRWETPEKFNFGRDVIDSQPADKPAMIWLGTDGSERRLTFGDLSEASNRFANAARGLGVRRGDRVLVIVGKRPEWHVILIGLLKLGAVAIPCAEQLRSKDLRYRAEHSGATTVISSAAGMEAIDPIRDELDDLKIFISLDEDNGEHEGWEPYERLTSGASDAFTTEDTAASEGALMLYTSGTTSNPKGVWHTHGYTHAKRVEAYYWLDLWEDDRLWCTSGTGWAKSIWNVFLGPWSHGVELFVHEGGFDPAERLRLIERYGITVLCQAPTEYRLLANSPELENADLSNIRHAVSAGEPLNAAVVERFRELHGLTIYDGYGQTENTLLVGNFPGMEVKPGSMGKPLPGCDVRIIDDNAEETPPDEPGDIALRPDIPAMFAEYYEQPDATEATRRGEFYVTGDRAVRDEDGYLWFMSRADDVILSAGYRIGPFEVESALIEHPGVVESAAVASPEADRGSVVKAFVVLASGYEGSDELVTELQDHCKSVTAPYKYPRRVEFVQELPKTASGKIRRVELRDHETTGQTAG